MDLETLEKVVQNLTVMLSWRKVKPVIKGWRSVYNDLNI